MSKDAMGKDEMKK